MKYPAIRLSDRFSITRDGFQWFLDDYGDSRVTESGKPKQPKQTYYRKFSSMAPVIVDRMMEGADSLEEIHARLKCIQDGEL